MKLRRTLLLSSLILALAALSPAAAQGLTPSPAVAAHQAPFVGLLRGVETNNGAFPFLVIQGTGTGIATQLGRFTYDNPHTVDLRTRSGCGFTWTFTAANGDTLTAQGCGQATVVSGTPPTQVLSIVETADITAGTGRFTGATGSFTIKRLGGGTTGKTIGYFAGTVSIPEQPGTKRTGRGARAAANALPARQHQLLEAAPASARLRG